MTVIEYKFDAVNILMLYIEKGKNRLLVIAVIKIHSVITIKALNL